MNVSAVMCSRNRAYFAVMQSDCRFVLYRSNSFAPQREIWSTPTKATDAGCYIIVQGDSNLVLYDGSKKAIWSSNTFKYGQQSVVTLN